MSELTNRARALVEAHLHTVGYHVSEMLMRVPAHVTRDDLASAGYLALVQAASAYSEESGVPFNRFAAIRIKGALVDELRSMDWASRGARKRIREYNQTYDQMTAKLARAPKREEMAAALGVDVAEVDHARDQASTRILSFEAYDGSLAEMVHTTEEGPERAALNKEKRDYLRCAVEALPERLRYVVEQVFYAERSVTEVAEELGVTQSRVSQLRAEAMVLLRDGMNAHLDPEQLEPAGKEGVVARRREKYFAEIGDRVEASKTAVAAGRRAILNEVASVETMARVASNSERYQHLNSLTA